MRETREDVRAIRSVERLLHDRLEREVSAPPQPQPALCDGRRCHGGSRRPRGRGHERHEPGCHDRGSGEPRVRGDAEQRRNEYKIVPTDQAEQPAREHLLRAAQPRQRTLGEEEFGRLLLLASAAHWTGRATDTARA